jgi:hypothetical protein
MKAHFSEFSYGYALTHELVNRFSTFVCAAPVFPSLVEEGRSGGGYDVQLDLRGHSRGYLLFLQFKLSEFMVRSKASQWEDFGGPYFRFQQESLALPLRWWQI